MNDKRTKFEDMEIDIILSQRYFCTTTLNLHGWKKGPNWTETSQIESSALGCNRCGISFAFLNTSGYRFNSKICLKSDRIGLVTPLKRITPRLWSLNLPIPILWDSNGCFAPNISLMACWTSQAWLVAKCYTQAPGLVNINTFNLVIKATIVHVVLSFAVTNK